MKSTFSWQTSVSLLVEEWSTSELPGLVAGMACASFLTILLECLRRHTACVIMALQESPRSDSFKRICLRLYASLLHCLYAASGYVTMLFLMSYNLWIFMSIVAGAGVGYFLLRPWVFVRCKGKSKFKHSHAALTKPRNPEFAPIIANDEFQYMLPSPPIALSTFDKYPNAKRHSPYIIES